MLLFNIIYLVIALFVVTLSYFNSLVFAYIILKPLSTNYGVWNEESGFSSTSQFRKETTSSYNSCLQLLVFVKWTSIRIVFFTINIWKNLFSFSNLLLSRLSCYLITYDSERFLQFKAGICFIVKPKTKRFNWVMLHWIIIYIYIFQIHGDLSSPQTIASFWKATNNLHYCDNMGGLHDTVCLVAYLCQGKHSYDSVVQNQNEII